MANQKPISKKEISAGRKRKPPRAKVGTVKAVKPKVKVVPLESMNDATYYHVIKRGDRWAVKKHGAERASGLYPTKAEAVNAAKEIKIFNKHIFVHKTDGSIDKWIRSRSA